MEGIQQSKEKAPTPLESKAMDLIERVEQTVNNIHQDTTEEIDTMLSTSFVKDLSVIKDTLKDAHHALAGNLFSVSEAIGELKALESFMPAIESMGTGRIARIRERMGTTMASAETTKADILKRLEAIMATPAADEIHIDADAEDKDRPTP
ncbi:MAG: hypothetical protein KBD06_00555 [Candidatus Pacebacteria bacterium]|nr:hypothetical protein [Candidatus Paceibacterota bacterium]